MDNKLSGKLILWNGDSICAGAESTGNWATRIEERNHAKCVNYAVGGGTIAEGLPKLRDGGKRHSVSETLEKMYEEYPDADYIVLEGGTNDSDLLDRELDYNHSHLGSVDMEDFSGEYNRNTFCGAMESVIYRALQYWNGKKICYIVAQKMGELVFSRRKRRLYFDHAVMICKKWGIPYVDLWEGCYLNPALPWMYNKEKTAEENVKENVCYYKDGQHLTSRGYDVTTEIIETFLKTI